MSAIPPSSGKSADSDEVIPWNSGSTSESDDEMDSSSGKVVDTTRNFQNNLDSDQENESGGGSSGAENLTAPAESTTEIGERDKENKSHEEHENNSSTGSQGIFDANKNDQKVDDDADASAEHNNDLCSQGNQNAPDNVFNGKEKEVKEFSHKEDKNDKVCMSMPTANNEASGEKRTTASNEDMVKLRTKKQKNKDQHGVEKPTDINDSGRQKKCDAEGDNSLKSHEDAPEESSSSDEDEDDGNENESGGGSSGAESLSAPAESTTEIEERDKENKSHEEHENNSSTGSQGIFDANKNDQKVDDDADASAEHNNDLCSQGNQNAPDNVFNGKEKEVKEFSHKEDKNDKVCMSMPTANNEASGKKRTTASNEDMVKLRTKKQKNKDQHGVEKPTDINDSGRQKKCDAEGDNSLKSHEDAPEESSSSDEDEDDGNADLWNFSVILGEKYTINAPQGEEALKWMFLFDCPHTLKELQKDPVMANAELKYDRGTSPRIIVEKAGKKLKVVKELLKKHANEIQIHHTVIPDKAIQVFTQVIQVLQLFKEKRVIKYKTEKAMYICCKNEYIEKAIELVNSSKEFALKTISEKEKISVQGIPLDLLKIWLNVNMPPDTSDIKFELNQDQTVLFIQGLDDSVIMKEKDRIQMLFQNITKKSCKAIKCVKYLEFFEEKEVAKYIQGILADQKLVCTWEIDQKDCCIIVTSFNKETCERACQMIDASYIVGKVLLQPDEVTRILPSMSYQQQTSSVCARLGGKVKIWIEEQEKTLLYVHTLDIQDKVEQEVHDLVDSWDIELYVLAEKQFVEQLVKEKQKLRNFEVEHGVTIDDSRRIDKVGFIIKGKKGNVHLTVKGLKSLTITSSTEAAQPRSGLQEAERICVPESNEAELFLLRDSSVLICKNSGVNLTDPETFTEVIEIIPEFTLKVSVPEDVKADVIVPSDKSTRPVKFYCPVWNESCSKEKHILPTVLNHLFEYISSLGGEALLEIQDENFDKWPLRKFVQLVWIAYQQHLKAATGSAKKCMIRLFLLVRNEKLYDTVRHIVFDKYPADKFTQHDAMTQKEEGTSGLPKAELEVLPSATQSSVIKVHVVKGVLTDRKEDVLVNSASQNLDLAHGKVSQSILKAAGNEIQRECKRLYSNGIKPGQVAITGTHNLKNSKLIFHGTFDAWTEINKEKCKKVLTEFVALCLQTAVKKNMKSIAFPAIGTGLLKYPSMVVADCMFEGVEQYCKTTRLGFDTEVFFVIYHLDTDTVTAFDERKKLFLQHLKGSSVDPEPSFPYGGARPKIKSAAPKRPQQKPTLNQKEHTGEEVIISAQEDELSEAQCLDNSEVKLSQELMEKIKKSSGKIEQMFGVKIMNEEQTIKGQLENLLNLEGYLRKLNLGDVEEISLAEEEEEEVIREAVDNIPKVKYQMFRYFFPDLCVSILHEDSNLRFLEEGGHVYVHGKSQEVVDKAIDDIKNAFIEMSNFQESLITSENEKVELVKQVIVKVSSESFNKQVFCYIPDDQPHTICITARSWEEVNAMKHKIELELGNIKITGRQGRMSSTYAGKNENGKMTLVSSERPPADTNRRLFTTAEGIKVFIYKCPILQADVDVIVNAANENLEHGGGVAKVIANSAGWEFIEESKRYVKKNGNLCVGGTCITSGGSLKFPFVIHTVGPKWDMYTKTFDGLQKCMDDLWKSVIGCFFKAELLHVQSIALPAISSGTYGVPLEICASQYLSAVTRYSKSIEGNSSLKEIHFTDVNDRILELIILAFSASFEGNQEATRKFDGMLQKVMQTFEQIPSQKRSKFSPSFKKGSQSSEIFEPHCLMKKNKQIFCFTKIFSVLVYTGNIIESRCKAIVSNEDTNFKSERGLSKAIKQKAGQKFDACIGTYRGKIRQIGDVVEVVGGNLKCEKVICCITPKFTGNMSNQDYKKELEQCFRNIMEKGKAYQSIAVPILGTGFKDASIKIFGTVLLDCMLLFSRTHKEKETIREVHVVSLDDGYTASVRSIFMEHFNAEKKRLDAERRKAGCFGKGSAAVSEGQGQPLKPEVLRFRENKEGSFDNKTAQHSKSRVEEIVNELENLASFAHKSNQPPGIQTIDRGRDDKQDRCIICMDTLKNPVKLKKCSHVFCKGCIDNAFQHKPICPTCSTQYGVITGNQPFGTMTENVYTHTHLKGYADCGTIQITYDIPDGTQSSEHPNPGKRYQGLKRKAYLPNNKKGKKVLQLLHLAFDRRLIFTVGQSASSGKENMVTWNDIHHKTFMSGGPERYGYPDPTYLDRVIEELAAKGVTEKSESEEPWTSSIYESAICETPL